LFWTRILPFHARSRGGGTDAAKSAGKNCLADGQGDQPTISAPPNDLIRFSLGIFQRRPELANLQSDLF
jgi:hypothetical protein